jgi:hypothetical protein
VSALCFQLDEDCQAAGLVSALRQHGIEVVTTNEERLQGVDEESQLREATKSKRVIVTNNIRDFVELHSRWSAEKRPPHAGIVVFAQQEFTVGETVRRLANLSRTLSSEEMANRLEWLNAWAGH